MLGSLKFELAVMLRKKEFHIALAIMMAVAVLAFYSSYQMMMNEGMTDGLYSWSPDTMSMICETVPIISQIRYIVSFVLVLPCCMSYINDSETGILPFITVKSGRRNYFYAKNTACFIGTFVIILIPYLFNLLLCYIAFPNNGVTGWGAYGDMSYYQYAAGVSFNIAVKYPTIRFISVFFRSHLLYTLLYILQMAFTCSMFSVLLLSISFLCRHLRYLLFLPVFALFRLTETLGQYFLNNAFSGSLFINHSLADYLTMESYGGQSPWFLPIIYGVILIFFFLAAWITIHTDRIILGGGRKHVKVSKEASH